MGVLPIAHDLFFIWIIVAPGPVDALFLAAQLSKITFLVMIRLILLVCAVFIAIPSVVVLVAFIIVALVVLGLPIFLILLVPVLLLAGRGHHRNGRGERGGQEK